MTAETKVHELKTWPEYYEKVESGEKTFEVRKLDRFFSVGDTLILKEWSPVRWQDTGGYSGRQVERKVSYLMNGGKWDIPEGICIMGLSAATPPDVEQISLQDALNFAEFMWANVAGPCCTNGYYSNHAGEMLTVRGFWNRFQPFRKAGQSAVQDATPQEWVEKLVEIEREKFGGNYHTYGTTSQATDWVIGNENDIEASQYKLPPGRYLLISLNIGCGWHKNRKMFEGQVFVKGDGDNFHFETEREDFDNDEGLYFYRPIVRPLQPIERNDEVIATQQAMPQCTEAGIPEPIEPVQEEESPWISVEDRLPEDHQQILFYTTGYSTNSIQKGVFERVDAFGRDEIFCGEGMFQLGNVSHWMPLPKPPISRLKSEIEELKRKA